jgi:hypothetical protein
VLSAAEKIDDEQRTDGAVLEHTCCDEQLMNEGIRSRACSKGHVCGRNIVEKLTSQHCRSESRRLRISR